MSLSPGRKLAHYEILDKLGAGGMGEVYRARDKTLGREVAIKVLPEAVSHDPEKLARPFTALRMSPDGRYLAFQIHGANENVWVYELNAEDAHAGHLRVG